MSMTPKPETVQKIQSLLSRMTLREKIGQTVQQRLSQIDCTSEETLEAFFSRYPVGSLFGGVDIISRFSTRENPREILERCAKYLKIPPSVAGDLEHGGGRITLPEPLAMAAMDSEEAAYEYGKWCAEGGRLAGYHWTFSPESDIAFQWLNPVNGHRGLGDDPERVKRLIPQVVRGLQDHGVSACCKHFPGDGSDFRDQHIGISLNRLPRERWMATYGAVYRAAIEAGVHSIMPGHISLPFQDPGNPYPLPATLSPRICKDLLRGELGFQGVLVSDALIMGGYVRALPPAERYLASMKAGINVLLWPELSYFDQMERALEEGRFTEEELDDSVRRILLMKEKQGLLSEPAGLPSAEEQERIILQGNQFGEKVAEQGAVLVRNRRNLLPLNPETTKRILVWFAANHPETVLQENGEFLKGLTQYGASVDTRVNGNCLELRDMERKGIRYDAVIFVFDSGLHAVLNSCRPVGAVAECLWLIHQMEVHAPIVISLHSPYLLMDDPGLDTLVNANAGGDKVQRALPRLLFGKVPFTGRSPVHLDGLLDVDPSLEK